METNETLTPQEADLVFALDIGTRSIIGVVGRVEDERLKVLAIDIEEHAKRAMLDGQIEDIVQVARVAQTVTHRLESKLGRRLTRVCVAAAGRALRMERARYQMALPSARPIDEELIGRLEAGAVSAAEERLGDSAETGRRFYLVGYTVSQYLLDHYPMTTLRAHNGRELEAEVVATFLPSEVVESLYAAMQQAGLEVVSLTLEPIAAINAAIPAELRLLNLVLADIGAGTSDIAVCREGSVVGYTMATVAGDEITEALMRAFLIDFQTAERLKSEMAQGGTHDFIDVLGLPQSVTDEELQEAAQPTAERLAEEIAQRIKEVNGGAPSALFLAGGGSKLAGLCAIVAERLGMDAKRVAVAGNNFKMSAFSEEYELENPEYATPLGIAVSAGLGLVSDSYRVTLNGKNAKLFRNGALSILEILLMNSYNYADLIGRTGKSLSVTVDGKRVVLHGGKAEPSVLKLNGKETAPSALVSAGDSIEFVPARHGTAAPSTLSALLGEDFVGRVVVNGTEASLETTLSTGDIIETFPFSVVVEKTQPVSVPTLQDKPIAPPVTEISSTPLLLRFNGAPLRLPPKQDGSPYYLMDLLQFAEIDFSHLERPVALEINGVPSAFTQEIKAGDEVSIYLQ